MAVKVQVRKKALLVRMVMHPWGKIILAAFVVSITVAMLLFTFFYIRYSRLIEAKLAAGPFAKTSMLLAAPPLLAVGDEGNAEQIAAQLRHSNYNESSTNRMGWYHLRPDAIEIYPGPDSYFNRDSTVVKFSGKKISQIFSLADNTSRTQYQLEPELISNLYDRNREKRRLVKWEDIPDVLIKAVISAEDKRFFQHAGFDPLRIIRAAYIDLKSRRYAQGASTITQELARNLWLDSEKTWRRKAAELLITLHLEQKLSKKEIFVYYANQVDLGRRGTFAIRGFGEAAQVYFGKDIRKLNLEEAATLAGLIQRPSSTNPVRWPERARQRRNTILALMQTNGFIQQAEYQQAVAAPMAVVRGGGESTDAPYFVDMVNDILLDQFQDRDFQTASYRVLTTLDLNLQRDASEAVMLGMREVDEQLRRRAMRGKKVKKGVPVKLPPIPEAQCALIALDPQTGEVKALIGGRNYGVSQLNRILAKRQPGSVFKPFVYAAALNTALNNSETIITTASTFKDEPTTFWFDNRPYQPSNFEHKFYGEVTLRKAIAKSLNIPTVEIAEAVGYGAVVNVARKAGMNMDIRPTPSVALGAYEVTPLEIAGAYTIYPQRGVYTKPNFIDVIRDKTGLEIWGAKSEKRAVLDPRVNYLMVNLLEEVMRTGTGAGVRARGFVLPAAGKTGTSHDGWFAGFTSKLLCVVWVGFDDNHELNLEGAHSALPIWTEFMKRAHKHHQYRNVTQFQAPDGIVSTQICSDSGQLATSACPAVRTEVFIADTQPADTCQLHGGGATQIAGWETEPAERPPEKKGFFGRIKGIFK